MKHIVVIIQPLINTTAAQCRVKLTRTVHIKLNYQAQCQTVVNFRRIDKKCANNLRKFIFHWKLRCVSTKKDENFALQFTVACN